MLTNGLRVQNRPKEQRELVVELHENGQAALGWAVGLVQQRVPKAVLDEARKRNFPVFVVPIETPFREIISFINGARLSDDLYVMRRVMAMQKFLMDALHLDDPGAAIVDRLRAMLEADVILFGADGSTVRHCGSTGPEQVADDVVGHTGDTIIEGDVNGSKLLGIPITTEHGCEGWLAVVLRPGPFAERIGEPVLRSGAQLLGLVAQVRHLGQGDERERRAEVLLACLEHPNGEQTIALDHRARALGIDFSVPARTVVWAPRDAEADPMPAEALEEAIRAVEALLAAAHARFLVAAVDGRVAAVVQREDDMTSELLTGKVRELGLRAGVGRAIRTLGDAQQSLTDAELALEHARNTGELVATFDRLDPASWLLASCDREVATQKVEELLLPLEDQERLLETLKTYFIVDMNVAEAARRLNVHRNTLRYRLARIEKLLDVRLDSPHTIANLHLALLTERLTEDGEHGGADAKSNGNGYRAART
jgi:purine catabolism regulator